MTKDVVTDNEQEESFDLEIFERVGLCGGKSNL
jgi:hypothetical protein